MGQTVSFNCFFCLFFGSVILPIPPQPCPSITHFWVQSSLRSRWSPARDAEIFKAELCYTYRLKQPVSKNRPSFEEAVELFRELTRPENKRLDNERNSQPRTCFVLKNSSEMQIVQLQRQRVFHLSFLVLLSLKSLCSPLHLPWCWTWNHGGDVPIFSGQINRFDPGPGLSRDISKRLLSVCEQPVCSHVPLPL